MLNLVFRCAMFPAFRPVAMIPLDTPDFHDFNMYICTHKCNKHILLCSLYACIARLIHSYAPDKSCECLTTIAALFAAYCGSHRPALNDLIVSNKFALSNLRKCYTQKRERNATLGSNRVPHAAGYEKSPRLQKVFQPCRMTLLQCMRRCLAATDIGAAC